MLKIQEKLFIKSGIRCILLFLLLGGGTVYNVVKLWWGKGYALVDARKYGAAEIASWQMYLYVYFFILILLLAFDYYREEADAGLLEVLKTGKACLNNERMHFLVMLQWITISYFIMLFSAGVLYKISGTLTGEVLLYLFKINALYILLNGICAVLLGWILARTVSKMIGYVCIVFVSCLVSPMLISELGYLSMIFNQIYEMAEAVLIMPEGLDSLNEFTLYPVNITVAARVVFWIFLLLCGLCSCYRFRRRLFFLGTCVIGACLSFAVMSLPASYYSNNNSYTKSDSIAYDQMTYMLGNAERKTREAGYRVTGYEMDLEMKLQMKAEVTVFVDIGSLNEYPMTLYHLYDVGGVVDQNGKLLDYLREGDYLLVKNETGDIQSLTITYSGGCANFYSNRKEINLPGWFAYYPMPGYHEIYRDYEYVDNRLKYMADFDVTVRAGTTVYADMERVRGNHFSGRGYGISLLGGFVKEITLENGTRCVYPYLFKMYDPHAEAAREDCAEALSVLDHKTVFFIPGIAGDTVTSIREDSVITPMAWRGLKDLLLEEEAVVTREEMTDHFVTGYFFMKEDNEGLMTYKAVRERFDSLLEEWGAREYSDEEFEQFIRENLGEKELKFIKGNQ